MSSYLSALQTHYSSLKRLIPLSNSEDHDLSTTNPQQDSHLTRVMRAYYTEKQRAFPNWLPPDPNAPPPKAAVTPLLNNLQSTYGQAPPTSGTSLRRSGPGGGAGGGLGDLFADSPQQQGGDDPASLRSGRRPGGFRNLGSQRNESNESVPGARNPYQQQEPGAAARPLPSQRVGSYQSRQSGNISPISASSTSSLPSSSQTGSVQERLKARLGGGASSRSQGAASPSPPTSSYGGGGNSVGTGGGYDEGVSRSRYGGVTNGSASNPYAQQSQQPPPSGRSDYGGGSGTNSYGNSYGAPVPPRRGVGLPSGPRPQR
ncbi:hypothetical protein MMC25_005710 [Agyrium rufum]|nr:hypothetical protein [Agyrium rufum]